MQPARGQALPGESECASIDVVGGSRDLWAAGPSETDAQVGMSGSRERLCGTRTRAQSRAWSGRARYDCFRGRAGTEQALPMAKTGWRSRRRFGSALGALRLARSGALASWAVAPALLWLGDSAGGVGTRSRCALYDGPSGVTGEECEVDLPGCRGRRRRASRTVDVRRRWRCRPHGTASSSVAVRTGIRRPSTPV
jgi:hypothetical protein